MSDKRVLFISQEIAPYLPSSEQADLGRNLPHKMMGRGFEVRTFMPRFGVINERRNQLHEVIRLSGMNISIDDNDHPLILKVASMHPSRIQVYFIDNDDYFQKLASDANPVGTNREDNDERAMFFAHGTSETLRKLRWEPKLIVCTGWFTALNPLYIRRMYASDATLKQTKIAYVLMPGESEGGVDARLLEKLKGSGMTGNDLRGLSKFPTDTTLLHRMAITSSDAVVINTPDPAPELLELIAKKKLPVLTYDKIAEAEDPAEVMTDFFQTLVK